MKNVTLDTNLSSRKSWRRRLRFGFLFWAVASTLWLANSVRTQGVDPKLLVSNTKVDVEDKTHCLKLHSKNQVSDTALVFVCGSGIAAEAYVPLLYPICEAGYDVFIIRLPWRFAPFESHKQQAMERIESVMRHESTTSDWVVAGHSLGGAIVSQFVKSKPELVRQAILVGTTHPKEISCDLSKSSVRLTKIFGSNDGVAPRNAILENQKYLPTDCNFIEIEGGNHSQFGHYGHQLLDGTASITRQAQQAATRQPILEILNNVSNEATQGHDR